MLACFPVYSNAGLDSMIYEHFSCAPSYIVVDIASGEVIPIKNIGRMLQYGTCDPITGPDDYKIDAVVVLSVGEAMQHKLRCIDIRVFYAADSNVGYNVNLLKREQLNQILSGKEVHAHY